MENTVVTEKTAVRMEKLSVSAEQVVESDLSLPDYLGDIVKILSCRTFTNITSASLSGDKAAAEGNIEIKVLYLNEKGEIELCESSYPFSRSVDVRDPEADDTVFAEVIGEQTTCRAVNRRRIDIRGSVTLKITVSKTAETEIVTDASPDFCRTLKEKEDGFFLSGENRQSFYINETTEISGIKPVKIVRSSCIPAVADVKTIKNKMMIKGSLGIDSVFLTAEGAFVSRRTALPVNRIIDMEGLEENSRCCVRLQVSSLDIKLTGDGEDLTEIEIAAAVSVHTEAYESKELTAVSEAYSPARELICGEGKVGCVKAIIPVNDNYTLTSQLDFSAVKGQRIIDVSIKKIKYTSLYEDGNITLKGTVACSVILEAQGEKICLERSEDFKYSKQISAECSAVIFEPQVYVNAVNYSNSGEFSATLNTELHIDGFAFCQKEIKCLTSIEPGKEKEQSRGGAICVYFAEKGERLWDIAKSHNSSVESIKSVNALEADVLTAPARLVFPLE